jgi:membrane-associated phospholipid phosphatase
MQRDGHPARPRRLAARLDPDTAGGLRLTLIVVAGFLVVVPFGLALVAVTDGWAPLRRLDLHVADNLNRQAIGSPGLVSFLKLVSNVFSPHSFEVVAVVVGVWLWARHSPRLGLWLALTVVLTDPLDTLVKNAVGRSRPHFDHPVDTLTSYSFPSGHALGSITGVGALLLVVLPSLHRVWRRVAVALGVAIVALVGYARIGLGVHYVSDVLGGWVLGAAWLAATTAAFRVWRRDLSKPTRPLKAGLEPAGPEPAVGSTAERKD